MIPYQNLQEVFNTAYLGLASQGFVRSVDGEDSCMYRGPNKTKCAIGHCVPDELIGKFDNGSSLGSMLYKKEWANLFQNCDSESLQRLQDVHDLANSADDVRQGMEKYAAENKLDVPEIPEIPS